MGDKAFLLTSKFCPLGGCLPLPRGYIHVLNHEKNCLDQTSKTFFLNLQQMNEVTILFCWHQNFVPWGMSAPALGLYTSIKSWKNCIKSDFKEIFFKLATNDRSDKMFLLTSKFRPQGVVSKWLMWQEVSVDIKILSSGVVCPWPAAIYIY